MPLGIRRSYTSKRLVSDSSTEDSDASSGKSTPIEANSSSSSSTTSSRDLYHKSRIPSRQFWMAASSTKLSDLLGFTFRHGRPWGVARLARMMHSEYVFCGFVAPFRALLFSALHYRLDRRLLSDFTACALATDPVVRNVALLESLLMMLQSAQVTHEFEPLTSYADNHAISKEAGLKADPALAVFLGYIAAHRIRELGKLQHAQDDTSAELHEVTLANQRSKIRQSLKSALCVPDVAGDVFLELARNYAEIDDEFSFEQVLKTYVNRNPEHLTGFLFYLEMLRRRSDADAKLRQLVTMRKIIHLSPADDCVLEYAGAILELGEIADVHDVATRLARYLDHWDRRFCSKGWLLLCSALIYSRKYRKSVDVMHQRNFWWQYHFASVTQHNHTVDIAKALFVTIVNGSEHEYVRLVQTHVQQGKCDKRLEMASDMLADVTSFRHQTLCNLLLG